MAEVRPIRNQIQGDGSSKQWENCAAASAGDAALRAKKNVNPGRGYPWATTSLPTMSSAIRKWCDNHFNTGAVSGLYQSWVNAAIRAMYGVVMGYVFGSAATWKLFISLLRDHRGVSVSITYGVIQDMYGGRYAAFANFRRRHRVFINQRRYNDNKDRYEFLVYDPGADGRRSWVPNGPQWWPADMVKKAMTASGFEFSYTPRTA